MVSPLFLSCKNQSAFVLMIVGIQFALNLTTPYSRAYADGNDDAEGAYIDVFEKDNDDGAYKAPKPIKKPNSGQWQMYCFSDGAKGYVKGICNSISKGFEFLSWNRLSIKPVSSKKQSNMTVRFTNKGNSHSSVNGTSSTVHGTNLHVALHEVGRQFGFGSCHLLTDCDFEPFSVNKNKELIIPRNADRCKILQGDKLTLGSNKNGARLLTAGQMYYAQWLTGKQVANYQGGVKCYDLNPLTNAMCSGQNCGPVPIEKLFAVQILSDAVDPDLGYRWTVQPDRKSSLFLAGYRNANCPGGGEECIAMHTSIGPASRRVAVFNSAAKMVIDQYLTNLRFKLLPSSSGSSTIRLKISDVPNDPMDNSCPANITETH